MLGVEDLKAALRRLRQVIEKYEHAIKNKVRCSRSHVRELYHAQRLCEEAAQSLCVENMDLRREVEEQKNRIDCLERQVDELQREVQDLREENRTNSENLQRQINEIKEQMKGKERQDNLTNTLYATLSAIENNSMNM